MSRDRDERQQDVWRRWEATLAGIRERTRTRMSVREQRLWLLAHVLCFGLLSWAVGYAAHRDGPWSLWVLGPSVVLALTLASIVVRLWTLT